MIFLELEGLCDVDKVWLCLIDEFNKDIGEEG